MQLGMYYVMTFKVNHLTLPKEISVTWAIGIAANRLSNAQKSLQQEFRWSWKILTAWLD